MGTTHTTFLNFWTAFSGELSGTPLSAAGDIMQYNWMSLPLDLSCVASTVAVAERPDAEGLLAGLRAFRDQGLKPLQTGRLWISAYYRHSPELAMLLLRDGEARAAALRVIGHFAEVGAILASHRRQERALLGDQPAAPPEVLEAVERLTRVIQERGSPELRGETARLREEMRPFERLSLREALAQAATMAPAEKGGVSTASVTRDLAPASRDVDWRAIRGALPPTLRPE